MGSLYDIQFDDGGQTQEFGESLGDVREFCKRAWPGRKIISILLADDACTFS